MRSGPCRCAGSQQDGLELRDGRRIERGIETPVARLLQAVGDAVVDEHRTTDVADGGRAQRAARLITNSIVGRAADEPIVFLEFVGEREDLGSADPVIGDPLYRYGPPRLLRHGDDALQLGPLIGLGDLIALHRAGEAALRAETEPLERHIA